MNRQNQILEQIKSLESASVSQIFEKIREEFSLATLKRELTNLVNSNKIVVSGKGKSSKYSINPFQEPFYTFDLGDYYEKEIDERNIKSSFNWEILTNVLPKINLFTEEELEILHQLQAEFQKNVATLSAQEYNKDFERLAIDLSWKSSQIEGNTYTLLETELLLKEKLTAKGKPKDDAVMLLNHKEAIDFLIENKNYLTPLKISKIEDLHSILVKELGINKNIRKRKVGISGTNYQPLDNDFQIKEALEMMYNLINEKKEIFEKALLVLLLISYIQPFYDGNKRTARIISNAILIDAGYCPISFRTVDSLDYKMAMLLFYEQNSISAFKKIFIEQYTFAVKTYF